MPNQTFEEIEIENEEEEIIVAEFVYEKDLISALLYYCRCCKTQHYVLAGDCMKVH